MAIGRPPREHEATGYLRLMSCEGVSIRGHPDLHAKHVIADVIQVFFLLLISMEAMASILV